MKTIAKYLFVIVVFALVVTSLIVVLRRPAQINRQTDVAALRSEIQRLQSKVGPLENRIEELQTAAAKNPPTQPFVFQVTNTPTLTPPVIQIPGPQPSIYDEFADPGHPPKIWGEGEFNGWKYYIIPLAGSPAAPSSAAQPLGLAGLQNAGPNR